MVAAVELGKGEEGTGVVVVMVAVGECGGEGAASTDTVRRADVLECRAVGCASDGGTERGHNADVAWRRGARVGGCCVEGGNEELV